jgi:hemerythrin-like domain-containing protein
MPKTKNTAQNEFISTNNHFNIIDILLLDHSYLKDCIEILKDEDEDKKTKLFHAKGFLDALKKHSAGEKKALYSPLEDVEDLHFNILESEIEHGIVDAKVKSLTPKIQKMRTLSEEMAAELKVLAELVEHHVQEEEDELFPKMRKDFSKEILNQMGYQFMVLRQFTEKDLRDTDLQEEIPMVKKSAVSDRSFVITAHKYFSSRNNR